MSIDERERARRRALIEAHYAAENACDLERIMATFSPDGFVVWDRTQHGCNTAAGDLVSARGGRDRRPPVCDWRTTWAQEVAAFDPDVVVVHVGTWESYDRWLAGGLARAGEAAWTQAQRDQFAGVFDASVYPEGYLDKLRREWP